jgi:hypothetical protein
VLEREELLEAVLALLPRHPDVSHAALTDGGDELVTIDECPGLEHGASIDAGRVESWRSKTLVVVFSGAQ